MKDPPSTRSLQLLAELKRQIMIKMLAESLKRDLQGIRELKNSNIRVIYPPSQEKFLDLPLFESLVSPRRVSGKVISISVGRKLKKAKG